MSLANMLSNVDARACFLHTRKTDCGKDHPRTMNLPTTNEICAIFNEDGVSNKHVMPSQQILSAANLLHSMRKLLTSASTMSR